MLASINCTLTRTLFPDRRTLPSRILETPSALPISRRFVGRPRYCITDVREITLRSLIFERFVSTSSWMPSAKYAFSFSSLKFSNGKTAIDLSTLCAATRGKRKKPVAAEITTPVAISMIMFRRRRGPGRGCVRCGPNPLRRDVERPRKNQGDWKSDEQQQNHQAQRPAWQFPCWEGRRSQLDDAAGSNDVGRRHPINFAAFYLLEEAGHKKSFDSWNYSAALTIDTNRCATFTLTTRLRRPKSESLAHRQFIDNSTSGFCAMSIKA